MILLQTLWRAQELNSWRFPRRWKQSPATQPAPCPPPSEWARPSTATTSTRPPVRKRWATSLKTSTKRPCRGSSKTLGTRKPRREPRSFLPETKIWRRKREPWWPWKRGRKTSSSSFWNWGNIPSKFTEDQKTDKDVIPERTFEDPAWQWDPNTQHHLAALHTSPAQGTPGSRRQERHRTNWWQRLQPISRPCLCCSRGEGNAFSKDWKTLPAGKDWCSCQEESLDRCPEDWNGW